MNLPTLVIAGAPKCGTSSLHAWLAAHPAVCVAAAKETRYLLDADSPLRPSITFHERGLAGYGELFAHCPEGEVIVESTPDYLYSGTALTVLADLPSKPRILFILRRPADRVYSFYQYARNHMAVLPRNLSFDSYLGMVREPGSPRLRRAGTLAHQLRYSDYAHWLAPWFAAFDRERLRVVLFEQLVADPSATTSAIADWAGIDPAFYAGYAFPRENETVEIRSQSAQRLRKRLAPLIRSTGLKGFLRGAYARVATTALKPMSDHDRDLVAQLEAGYQDANRRLAEMAELDVDRWWAA